MLTVVQYIVLSCNKFIKNNRYVLHSAGESLVLLGIVVLEADLQVDGLHELAFFGLLGMLEHLGHALKEGFLRYFTKIQRKMRLEGLGEICRQRLIKYLVRIFSD